MFMFTTNKLDLAVIIFTCNVCTMLAVVPSQIWLCIFFLKQKLIFGYQKTGKKMFKKIKFKTIKKIKFKIRLQKRDLANK